jgi:uncharacterized protein YecT (DUF1311 family)
MKRLFLPVALIAMFAVRAGAGHAGSDLAKARSHFEAADAALNKTYKSVCNDLDEEKLAGLRASQRDWLKYRDEIADARSRLAKEISAKRRPDFWESMASLTKERTEYLGAYSGKNIPAGISGEYHDSYGGAVLLEERKDGVAFSIEVVRGHAMNEGSLDGLAIRKGEQAFFKDRIDPADPAEPCEIALTFIEGHIVRVEEKNAGKYQGHNAHFEGLYYKTGPLKEPLKLDVSRT